MSSCCDKKSRIHERPLGVKVSSVSKVLRFIEKTNNIQIFHEFSFVSMLIADMSILMLRPINHVKHDQVVKLLN